MEVIKHILNNVASKTAKKRGLKPGDDLSFYLRVEGIVDYVKKGRLQTVTSENDDTHCICRTVPRISYLSNDNTEVVAVRLQLIDENCLKGPFSYNVLGIEPAPATL